MKKFIAVLLVLTMAMSFAACGNSNADSTTEATDAVELPESALTILETVWASYTEEEKLFPVVGGDSAMDAEYNFIHMVEGAPGVYSLEDTEALQAQLLVPQEDAGKITEAASLFHAMNVNNFTAGAFRVADAAAFAETMHTAVVNNQWICGSPEKLVIATIGNAYVVVVFGLKDAVDPFQTKLADAYPQADTVYLEDLT